MGLTKCEDCGREVSDRIQECPHCGGPLIKDVSLEKDVALYPSATESDCKDDFLSCAHCIKCEEDTFFICPSCDKQELQLTPDGAKCECGHVIKEIVCECGNLITPQNFFKKQYSFQPASLNI